jgi:hypothetical protein
MNFSQDKMNQGAKVEADSKVGMIEFFESRVGIVGYFIDVFRAARCSFNFDWAHSLTKFRVINSARKITGATTFVESGTFRGDTTNRASRVFGKVYTIELGHELAVQAKNRFRNKNNVVVVEGDATVMLPQVFENNKFDKAIVFLDGHFSDGVTACGDIPEPAIQELENLAKYRQRISAIVIDDFRTFGVLEGFPSKTQLIASAETLFGADGYKIAVVMDQMVIYKPKAPPKRLL